MELVDIHRLEGILGACFVTQLYFVSEVTHSGSGKRHHRTMQRALPPLSLLSLSSSSPLAAAVATARTAIDNEEAVAGAATI